MTDDTETRRKPVRTPDATHPMTIVPNPQRVTARLDGHVIADSRRTLTLREAALAPVHYFPREDVDMSRLTPTAHATYCPFKGDCAYFTVTGAGERGVNAAWSYEKPHAAAAAIAGHIAFYRDRIAVEATDGP